METVISGTCFGVSAETLSFPQPLIATLVAIRPPDRRGKNKEVRILIFSSSSVTKTLLDEDKKFVRLYEDGESRELQYGQSFTSR